MLLRNEMKWEKERTISLRCDEELKNREKAGTSTTNSNLFSVDGWSMPSSSHKIYRRSIKTLSTFSMFLQCFTMAVDSCTSTPFSFGCLKSLFILPLPISLSLSLALCFSSSGRNNSFEIAIKFGWKQTSPNYWMWCAGQQRVYCICP